MRDMVRERFVGLGLGLVLLGTGGCTGSSPDPEESMDMLQASRAALSSEIQDVARELTDAGLVVDSLAGEFRTCRSEPAPGLRYHVGGLTTDDERPLDERIDVAGGALDEAGWDIEIADGRVTALREGVELSVSRTARRGSQALGFGMAGDCIDADSDETDALLGETDVIPLP